MQFLRYLKGEFSCLCQQSAITCNPCCLHSSFKYWPNKHFGINSECFSELVQNILHFHFTKKKIEVYFFEEISNIPPCYRCYQIEETLYDTMIVYTPIGNKYRFLCVVYS